MKIRSRWVTWCAARLAVGVGRLLFATCRKVYLQPLPYPRFDERDTPEHPECFVVLFWHDAILIPALGSSRPARSRTCVLTSRHHDGGYIVELMRCLGMSSIRGSTGRSGAGALRQMMALRDRNIVVTPDGPRGPRHVMKPGAIYLAAQTGRRIVATAFACTRAWRPRGKWTDLLIPKPFSTIYFLCDLPRAVPSHLSRAELEQYVAYFQRRLDALQQAADLLAGRAVTVEHVAEVWQRAA
ncbi:MAG: hypothetical protein KatS3mg114_1449 [Planctomycetaceae bacterium]|nr:MAG: hypothetical protein KatS3mg114_1449 [Planctomycetaceae bacterium]